MTVTRAGEARALPDANAVTTGTDVTSLVELAIREKVPVEVLERLVALQERITDRNARAAFFQAVADFQDRCPPILKTKTAKITARTGGVQFSYDFAPLEEIAKTIRPLLRELGLSYSWTVDDEPKKLKVTCTLRHTEGHETSSTFPVPVESAAAMSDAQKYGSALTYGKRQSLTSVLGLTTADKDTDAAQAEAENESPELITESEAADLSALADEVGGNHSKFLAMFGAQKFGDIRKSDLATARRALEQKRKA